MPTAVPGSEVGNMLSGVTDMVPGTTITLIMDQLKSVVNATVEMVLGRREGTPAPPSPP